MSTPRVLDEMRLHHERLSRLIVNERVEDRTAFEDMKRRLEVGRKLSDRQIAWIDAVHTRLGLDSEESLNLYSSGRVAIGRPVPIPDVLKNLPRKPPGRL